MWNQASSLGLFLVGRMDESAFMGGMGEHMIRQGTRGTKMTQGR